MTLKLAFDKAGNGPPLVIVHGLFGSKTNWRTLARRFSDSFTVYTIDQRNHGESPWNDVMSYAAMADDLEAFLDIQQLPNAHIIGHSMGGKTAMSLALRSPQRVSRLVVMDIAPVTYRHDHYELIQAMEKVPVEQMDSRSKVDNALAESIPHPGIRSFLLQNLRQGSKGGFQWRINLKVLHQAMENLTGFPQFDSAHHGPVLFLSGARSDYVLPEHQTIIDPLFPDAEMQVIEKAGHWLHAEQPDAVFNQVTDFLGRA